MVAGLGAAFLFAESEIIERLLENSAAYMNGWMEKLEKNPKWIGMASLRAEKAYRYIIADKDQETI